MLRCRAACAAVPLPAKPITPLLHPRLLLQLPYGPTSRQYAWAAAQLAAVDHAATPWLVVLMHGAPRTTYAPTNVAFGLFKASPLFLSYWCACVCAPSSAHLGAPTPANPTLPTQLDAPLWGLSTAPARCHSHFSRAGWMAGWLQELEEFMGYYEPLFNQANVDMVSLPACASLAS